MFTKEDQLKKEYEEKLSALRREQSNCNHIWDEPIYDPEITKEPCEWETVRQGVDYWCTPTAYKEVKKDRWSRTCKNCGKVEYTKETIIVKTAPKF